MIDLTFKVNEVVSHSVQNMALESYKQVRMDIFWIYVNIDI